MSKAYPIKIKLTQFVQKSDLSVFVTVLANVLRFLQSFVVTIPLRRIVQYEYLCLFKHRRTGLSDTSISPDTYSTLFAVKVSSCVFFCFALNQSSPPFCSVYRYLSIQTVYIV